MPEVARRYTVGTTGIGQPDYSKEVGRAAIHNKLPLKSSETLKQFSIVFSTATTPFSWVTSPLAGDATASFVDISTGDSMPYTIPAGYSFEALLFRYTGNQLSRIELFLEGYLFGEHYVPEDCCWLEQPIGAFSSLWLDPTSASSHIIEATVTNLSEAPMRGAFKVVGMLKAVGTEPITSKVCVCKWCKFRKEVPLNTTELTCPECGKVTLYWLDETG